MGDDQEHKALCLCSGTTKHEIRKLIEDGTTNLERISRITGAMSGCGGCEADLRELVEDHQPVDTEE